MKRNTKLQITLQNCIDDAAKNGGFCLSAEYVRKTNSKMDWKCIKGHTWSADYSNIIAGMWCFKCRTGMPDISDIQQYAAERGGKCLSTEYVNSYTKLKFVCAKGHEWEKTWHETKDRRWCLFCAGTRHHINDLHAKAREHGGKCHSVKYVSIDKHYQWECKLGHRWESTWTSVYNGSWCEKCYHLSKMLTVNDCQELAQLKGGKFLSTEYTGTFGKYEWECELGHRWFTTRAQVYNGQWCRKCSHLKYTIDDIRALCREKGGEFLDTKYEDTNGSHNFKCAKGHVWKTVVSLITASGSWCPECGRLSKMLTIEDCQELALKHNGVFLSESYNGTFEEYIWGCDKGHQWPRSHQLTNQGAWCPECSRKGGSKGAKMIESVLNHLDIKYTKEVSFDGLFGMKGGKLRFDFKIEDEPSVLEYDGGQHFEEVKYFGGLTDFKRRILHDMMKSVYCLENGITLIRIAFDEDIEKKLMLRLERAKREKFVMFPCIPTKYEGQVEALFSDEARYVSSIIPSDT